MINECNEPTRDGTTTFHPTINLLSQVSLQPITPIPYSKHECGTHRTHKKTPINMDSTGFLHLHCEELECLLVSQDLPCIHGLIQGSLGPTPIHTLQALLCILLALKINLKAKKRKFQGNHRPSFDLASSPTRPERALSLPTQRGYNK